MSGALVVEGEGGARGGERGLSKAHTRTRGQPFENTRGNCRHNQPIYHIGRKVQGRKGATFGWGHRWGVGEPIRLRLASAQRVGHGDIRAARATHGVREMPQQHAQLLQIRALTRGTLDEHVDVGMEQSSAARRHGQAGGTERDQSGHGRGMRDLRPKGAVG